MVLRAVVFDLDGTLAVTSRDRQTLLDDAADAADAPPLARSDYLDAHATVVTGETRTPIFERLLENGDPPPEAVARAYREAVNDALEPIDGARSLIEELGRDYRVGVLTDGPEHAQRSKLERLGWTDCFDAVLVTGARDTRKPDPTVFSEICDRLGVDPGETVYVGDNPDTDIVGATDAGVAAVQVVFDGGPEPHPAADAVIDRDSLADELPVMLRRLETAEPTASR